MDRVQLPQGYSATTQRWCTTEFAEVPGTHMINLV